MDALRAYRLVLLVSILAVPASAADVYEWVDKSGVVNYSQLPPEGVQSKRIRTSVGRDTREIAQAPSPRQPRDPRLNEEQQAMLDDLRHAEDQRRTEVARVRQSNCQRSRALLDRLSSVGRIRVTGDDGVQRVMDDNEREQRIAEAQEGIAVNCDA